MKIEKMWGSKDLLCYDPKNEKMTRKKLSKKICKTNRVTAFRDLNDLVKKSIIKKVGKTGRWAYYVMKR